MLYYKGHKILGVNFLPRYTLAQYTALSVKPHYWIRTDAPFRYSGVITTLDDLTDVEISNPTDKQVLTYNATSQKWENKDAMGGMLPQIVASTDTGSTVVATKGGITIPLTETSTGVFECVLYNGSDTYGEWTLTATLNGDTETTTVDVDTVKIYNVTFAPPIPDGSTVLPTDDIEILLNCANIWDSPITTLSELLADSTTLETVINDNNAIDYLVRSTSFASDIASNQTAMSLIGLNNYASNTLLADSTWLNAICNSAYFNKVLNTSNPTMTSNTTPAGNLASVSDAYESVAYQIFDNNDTTKWLSMSNNPWAKLELATPFAVNRVMLKYADVARSDTLTLTIAGSNDDVTYSTIDTVTTNLNSNAQTFAVLNNTAYKYYKFTWNGYLYISGQYNARVATIQFNGRVDGGVQD